MAFQAEGAAGGPRSLPKLCERYACELFARGRCGIAARSRTCAEAEANGGGVREPFAGDAIGGHG